MLINFLPYKQGIASFHRVDNVYMSCIDFINKLPDKQGSLVTKNFLCCNTSLPAGLPKGFIEQENSSILLLLAYKPKSLQSEVVKASLVYVMNSF